MLIYVNINKVVQLLLIIVLPYCYFQTTVVVITTLP